MEVVILEAQKVHPSIKKVLQTALKWSNAFVLENILKRYKA